MRKYLIFILSIFLVFAFACNSGEEKTTKTISNDTSDLGTNETNSTEENNIVSESSLRLNNINTNYVTTYPKKTYLDSIYTFCNDYTNLIVNDSANIVYSPFNIYIFLSAISEASTGKTKEEICNALGTDEEVKKYIQYLIGNINYAGDDTIMKVGNGLWFNKKYQVNQDFLDTLQEYYYAEAFSTDFSSDAKEEMADWLNDYTNNMFNVTPESFNTLNTASQIAYISTLYINVSWKQEFQEYQNFTDIFYNFNGKNNEVTFMKKTEEALYQETDDYEALTLGISKGSIEFILPKGDLTVSDLCKDDVIYNILNDEPNNKTDNVVANFIMPKISYKSYYDLNDNLKELGIKSIFSVKNELSFIEESNYYFGPLIQYNGIIFNEKGVEAASFIVPTIDPQDENPIEIKVVDFTLNRPFIFIIKSDYNVPLYIGIVREMD